MSQELLDHYPFEMSYWYAYISYHVCKERHGITLGPAQEKGEARAGEG